MWYWKAAQQGEERAKQRMKAIHQAGGAAAPDTAKAKKGLFSKLGL
jgi:hypothetical protein